MKSIKYFLSFILLLKSFIIQAQDLTIKHKKAYDFLIKQKTLIYIDSTPSIYLSKKENSLRFSKEIIPMDIAYVYSDDEWKSLVKEFNFSDSLLNSAQVEEKYAFYPYISKDKKYRFPKNHEKPNYTVFFSRPINNVIYAMIYPSKSKKIRYFECIGES